MRVVKAEEATQPSPETQVEMYRVLLTARMTDERCWLLNRGGQAPFVISCQGQEGAQVGSGFALHRTQDWFAPYYRHLGAVMALGIPPRAIPQPVMGPA